MISGLGLYLSTPLQLYNRFANPLPRHDFAMEIDRKLKVGAYISRSIAMNIATANCKNIFLQHQAAMTVATKQTTQSTTVLQSIVAQATKRDDSRQKVASCEQLQD